MNKQAFEDIVQSAIDRKVALRRDKGAEYTQGDEDVLANFKKGGIELDLSPLKVWRIYYKKHDDAIVSFIKNGHEISTEGIEGRIDDMQVYLDLLRGLVAEHKEFAQLGARHEELNAKMAAVIAKEEVPF